MGSGGSELRQALYPLSYLPSPMIEGFELIWEGGLLTFESTCCRLGKHLPSPPGLQTSSGVDPIFTTVQICKPRVPCMGLDAQPLSDHRPLILKKPNVLC